MGADPSWGLTPFLNAPLLKKAYSIFKIGVLKSTHRIPLHMWRKMYEAKETIKGTHA